MHEVSDSLHLRRFCLIPLDAQVPDESTIRKLTRRLGAETVAELSRFVIGKARREKRFRARAVRIDSTVVEADVRSPTDARAGRGRGASTGAGEQSGLPRASAGRRRGSGTARARSASACGRSDGR